MKVTGVRISCYTNIKYVITNKQEGWIGFEKSRKLERNYYDVVYLEPFHACRSIW